jgi:hypothetical protein
MPAALWKKQEGDGVAEWSSAEWCAPVIWIPACVAREEMVALFGRVGLRNSLCNRTHNKPMAPCRSDRGNSSVNGRFSRSAVQNNSPSKGVPQRAESHRSRPRPTGPRLWNRALLVPCCADIRHPPLSLAPAFPGRPLAPAPVPVQV